jgi:hypothetical protein
MYTLEHYNTIKQKAPNFAEMVKDAKNKDANSFFLHNKQVTNLCNNDLLPEGEIIYNYKIDITNYLTQLAHDSIGNDISVKSISCPYASNYYVFVDANGNKIINNATQQIDDDLKNLGVWDFYEDGRTISKAFKDAEFSNDFGNLFQNYCTE